MKRETKFNLIFLGAFLAISIPGAVMLFIKKLDPNASRMSMPDPVRKRLPFMTPPGRPGEELGRYVPEQAGAWLDGLTMQESGERMLLWNHRPAISEDRLFQVMNVKPGDPGQMALIVWTPECEAVASHFALQCEQDGKMTDCEIVSIKEMPIPANVRKELVGSGYNKPPQRVIWMNARAPVEMDARQPAQVRLKYAGAGAIRWRSALTLFVHGASESTPAGRE